MGLCCTTNSNKASKGSYVVHKGAKNRNQEKSLSIGTCQDHNGIELSTIENESIIKEENPAGKKYSKMHASKDNLD